MVYETDFYTTRRSYTRPVVSSYSVSYPVTRTITGSSRIYSASYPVYSYSPRITTHKRIITSPIRTIYSTPIVRTRVITSPIRTTRVYTSPIRTTRVYTSPVRTISSRVYESPIRTTTTTTRVYTSPVRDYLLPYSSTYTTPYRSTRIIESPVRVYTTTPWVRYSLTPERVITSPIRTLPSVLNREYSRIANRVRPGYGYHQLTNYLNSEPFINFEEETKRIRNSTHTLMRELHTPVIRRARSVTPFSTYYEPSSQLALDSYVARVTNPTRHLAKEVHNLVQYPESPRRYIGKSHLASVKILGDSVYNTRNPLYNPDKVRTDINLLSRYIQDKRAKSEISDRCVVSEAIPDLDPFRPSRKFSAPKPLEDPIDEETKEKQRLRQERLMTVTEEASVDDVAVEKKKAHRDDELKRLEAKALEEEKKKKAEAERKAKLEAEKLAEEARKADEEARKAREARLAEQARLVEEAKLAEEARLAEEAKLAEQAKLAEEAKLAEQARLAEEARIAEEARLAEEAKKAEEARLAEEARKAEEQRLNEEQKLREEELNRLAELEKIAEEEREAELARQAAELAEIARQEAEIAAQELQAMQQSSTADEAAPAAEAAPVEEDSKPVIEEPLSPIGDPELQRSATDTAVSIDEVKSDIEE